MEVIQLLSARTISLNHPPVLMEHSKAEVLLDRPEHDKRRPARRGWELLEVAEEKYMDLMRSGAKVDVCV